MKTLNHLGEFKIREKRFRQKGKMDIPTTRIISTKSKNTKRRGKFIQKKFKNQGDKTSLLKAKVKTLEKRDLGNKSNPGGRKSTRAKKGKRKT